MMQHSPIEMQVSAKELTLAPGEREAVIEVVVFNDSDRFASFQIDLTAAGVPPQVERNWYSLEPEISSKKPPGDRTDFRIRIFQAPIPDFVGLMNITVRVFSVDLQAEERQILRLAIEETGQLTSLKIELPEARLQGYPGERLDIPLRIYNPSKKIVNAQLFLAQLPPTWFIEPESYENVVLLPYQWWTAVFHCSIPELNQAPSQTYPFSVRVVSAERGPTQSLGQITVLPAGEIAFEATQTEQRIPAERVWLPRRRAEPAIYNLQLNNQSNVRQQIALQLLQHQRQEDKKRSAIKIKPKQVELLPGAIEPIQMKISVRRPWLGWGRQQSHILEAEVRDPQVEVVPSSQALFLKVMPIVPRWLQGVFGFLLLWLLAWLWGWRAGLLNHQGPVTDVRFNGLGTLVISTSNDQTARAWQVNRDRLKPLGAIVQVDKAIRTLRYRPVDNNLVALGLENGESQIWSLLSRQKTPLKILSDRADDRVMALTFSQDSRYLFSGHGSGAVLQWYVGSKPRRGTTPLSQYDFDFAISAIALAGEAESTLIAGGRYNRLALWDWQREQVRFLPEQRGGQDDYITTLAIAEVPALLLAEANSQGDIKLWSLEGCLKEEGACTVRDRWNVGNTPIRSIALSANGCYLAGAGDDGKLRLWLLDNGRRRAGQRAEGQEIADLPTKLNSVDLVVVRDRLLLVVGGDNGRVKLYRQPLNHPGCISSMMDDG